MAQCLHFEFYGLFVLCFYIVISLSIATHVCPQGFFYDHVYESCTNCSEICVKAKVQRSAYDCKYDCPMTYAIKVTKTSQESTILAVQWRRLFDVLVVFGGVIVFILVGCLIKTYSCPCPQVWVCSRDTPNHQENNTWTDCLKQALLYKKRHKADLKIQETLINGQCDSV